MVVMFLAGCNQKGSWQPVKIAPVKPPTGGDVSEIKEIISSEYDGSGKIIKTTYDFGADGTIDESIIYKYDKEGKELYHLHE